MTASAVSIHRLSATARLEEERPEDAARVARLLRRVAAERLDRALRDAPLPPGIWCVHHLDVPVRLDLERPDPALEVGWAAALAGALSRALRSGAPEVVRYDHERDALADLVCGAVTGRLGRAWAWRRLGLLDPADPPLEQAPGGAVVAALARHPRQALGVLVTAADRVGLPALHHALGPSGWTALAGVVRRALGDGHVGRSRTAPAPDGPHGEGGGAALAAALVAGSRLAEQIRRSRVRPDPESLHALAVLVAAERDASVPWRAAGGALVAAVAGMLGARGQPAPPPDRAQGAAGGPAGGAGPGGGTRPGVGERPGVGVRPPAPGERRPSARRGEAAAPATGPPGLQPPDGLGSHPPDGLGPHQGGRAPAPGTAWPDDAGAAGDQAAVAERDRRGRSTDWGGLLFLLATAADAGIPDTVLDDAVLAARPLPWILQGIALRLLPVTARDAAVAAFAATDPEEPPPWELGPPAGDDELARLELVARRWAAVTAAALGEPDGEPRDVVASIARRRGLVDHAPGWLEIHLDLDQVDVAVRRAGLDLDPGWVPWLGTVVRFVYG